MNELFFPVVYAGIFAFALCLAVWKRKTFPLGESLTVTLIVGIGFTGLVYLVTPHAGTATNMAEVQPGEMIFTMLYLLVVSALLIREQTIPTAWKGSFIKEEAAKLGFKLVVFVLIPLSALTLVWHRGWAELGFSMRNWAGQLVAAGLLILVLGGFNLIAGGGAAPLRAREFSSRQILLGFGIVFPWMILEVGLVEEFFFRAFLQTRLINFFHSPVSGICAASLLFGLAHVPGIYLRGADKVGPLGENPSLLNSVLYAILVLSTTGWFTGLLYWRTQSLLAPILVHAALDAVANAAGFIRGLRLSR